MLKERGFKPMHLHLDRNVTRDFDDGNKHEVCKRSADCEKPIIDAVKKGMGLFIVLSMFDIKK
jgi:hypothetical protein